MFGGNQRSIRLGRFAPRTQRLGHESSVGFPPPPKFVRSVFRHHKGRFTLQTHVAGGGNLLGFRASLLDGERGTAQTVHLMRQLIDQALNDPQFVRFAIDLVRNVPAYDDFGEVASIFGWVQDNIRYTKDPVTKEKLTPPMELLKIQAGDCDDTSMLIAALAIAVGYPARLVTVAANPNSPNDFSHVYPEVEVPAGSGTWLALDAARPNSALGLQPPVYFRKKAWSLTDDTAHEMHEGATRLRGLSGYMYGLGDDSVDWNAIIGQSILQSPQIIAASMGQSTSARLPSGAVVSTGNPYSSFASPYTPGYAVPAGGYLPQVSSTLFSSALPWLAVGLVALFAFRRS